MIDFLLWAAAYFAVGAFIGGRTYRMAMKIDPDKESATIIGTVAAFVWPISIVCYAMARLIKPRGN